MKKLLLRLLIAIIICAGVFAIFTYLINPYLPWEPDASLNPDPNHTHADFAVWIHGQQLNLDDPKYMSGLSYDDASHDEADEYHHEYLHLHDGVGHVLHRHKPELTLGEFFASIGLHMTQSCFTLDTGEAYCNTEGDDVWRMFINGIQVEMNPEYVFLDLDTILLSYGSSNEEMQDQLKHMTDDACLYSRACPWRGTPPQENCIADPSIPCTAPDL